MTRTMLVLYCLLFWGLCNTSTAGVHNDYEVCAGNCEQRLEGVSPNSLNATICYDTPQLTSDDLREEKIRLFFLQHRSPAAKYASLFVQVADENHLDWRLLPTFAFIESGGGKSYCQNNIFGWDSGKARFKSIDDAIRRVGRALTLGPYKDKTPKQVIRIYNAHTSYHRHAEKVMKLIDT